jgi:hypothetical protein
MSSPRTPSRARLALYVLLLASVLPAIGCVGTSHNVTGKVTLNGAPVPGGTIYFTYIDKAYAYNPDGSVASELDIPEVTSATIASDGTYSVDLKESYTYTITLTNPQAPLSGPIPDRYAQDTGLRYTVLPDINGNYTCNVGLTP